jgi:hypothetical protein
MLRFHVLNSTAPQVNVDDGFLNLMTQDGTAKDDVKVPEGDLGKQIEDDFAAGKDLLVTIVSAMGEEQVCLFAFRLQPCTHASLSGHLRQGGP